MKTASSIGLLWRHKMRFALFLFGLACQFVAMLIGNSDNLPSEYRFIAPSYHRAQEGLKLLQAKHTLHVGQIGYKELSAILVNYAKEWMTEEGATTFTGDKPDWVGVTTDGDLTFNEHLLLPQNRPAQHRSVMFNLARFRWDFSKVNPIFCPIDTVKEGVASLKGPGIWMSSLFIFLLGAVVEFLALFRELPGSATPTPLHRPEPANE
jgi:hypothetical protein